MPNLKQTFVKRLIGKFDQISLFTALFLCSANVFALGLGNFVVESNLDQPLNGAIELRTSPGDDLSTLEASIATRDEFDSLGVEYSDYVSDISLTLNTNGSPVIEVTSNDVIIKEPFIHFLVKVNWSGGSFLREYTALIDPPVYAAETPKPVAAPRTVGTDQTYQTDSVQDIVVEELESADVIDEVIDQDARFEEPAFDDSGNEEYYQPGFDQSSNELTGVTDARYGPVERGESLSFIALGLQQQFPDLSIYQIMKVLFEENPEAFIDGNINGLISGALLNVGDINAIRAVDIAESRAFFSQQVNDWNPASLISDNDSIKVGQSEYEYDSGLSDDDFGSDSSLETTDSFQVGSSSDTDSFVSSAQGDSSQGEVLALRQEIADLETSLASSSLENQELSERISILEGQLADMNRVMNLGVEDAELASLESTLAEQNNAADAPLIDQTLSTELDGSLELDSQDSLTGVDGSLIETEVDDFLAEADDSLVGADGSLAEADGSLAEADGSISEEALAVVEPTPEPVVQKPAPTNVVTFQSNEKSWMETLKSSVVDSGLWRIIAAVVGFLALGFGFLMYRRRRVDEEFEISMLSIESNSQSMEANTGVSDSTQSASVSVQKGAETDKETSFLTVYSDSDAVVQADEVDPIAEADVYIAYGRDEQAEEVLLDGVASHPERGDIKVKLLGLYHKTQNAESFERLSEELYANRETLAPNTWQEICEMGKDILPNNPLFDLSSSDIAIAEKAEDVSEPVVDQASDTPSEDEAPAVSQADTDANDLADEQSILSLSQDQIVEEFTTDSFTDSDDFVSLDEAEAESSDQADDVLDFSSDSDDGHSVQLVNFDEGRSEISELDEIEIDELDIQVDSDDDDDEISIDIVDDSSALELESDDKAGDDDSEEQFIQEVSDLEIDDDYDEARTQFELAKVFVDLGDEDGARKILNDIIDNKENTDMVIKDSRELLDSIV